jgi:hypothetical protein
MAPPASREQSTTDAARHLGTDVDIDAASRAGFTRVRARPYDHAVDLNMARHVLRIFPDARLSVELIERAYAGESWARHPSLYPDAADRLRAEEWAQTLNSARDLLLADVRTAAASNLDAAAAPVPRRRGLSRGAIIGIVAGAVALLGLITVIGIGAATLATTTADAVNGAIGAIEASASDAASDGSGETEFADVERYQSGETMYAFAAALELYNDGRLDAECPSEYKYGCWEMALFTEANCDTMEIELGFTNDIDAMLPDYVETVEKTNVLGNEPTNVVFGHDDYDFGWINQVTCVVSAT